MFRLTKPAKLRAGDKVAAITLSWGGPGTHPHRYEVGKQQFQETFGIEVVETKHALKDPKWVYQNPRARADDLMEAFQDPSIRGIISTIGGEDSVRLLPFLDLSVIRHHPKIVLGYSDTTVTHMACLNAGLSSFYGPSFMAGFAENGGMFGYMVNSVKRSLFSSEPIGQIEPNTDGWTIEFLDWEDPSNQNKRRKLNPSDGWRWIQGSGKTTGHLIGGCADVLEFLKGTEYWPSKDAWDGAILFLETSENAISPSQFRYWIRNYGTIGVLNRVNGILFGRPGGQVNPEDFRKYDEVLLQVVSEEFGRRGIPIITCMDFGHTDPMFVIPYGATAEIDCAARRFAITDGAVVMDCVEDKDN